MKPAGMGFALFISLFFLIGLGLLGWGLASAFKARAASRWPQAHGKITHCELAEDASREDSSWQVKVSYDYTVGARRYTGGRIAFGYAGSSTREEHEVLHARLAAAKGVSVRYNPARPEEAVLSAGVHRSQLVIVVFALVWLGFTTGFTMLVTMSSGADARLADSILLVDG